MQKITIGIAAILLSAISLPGWTLEVQQTMVEIGSQQARTRYQILNNSQQRQSYSVDVVKTTFPDSRSQTLPMPQGEIRVSPQTVQLSPGQVSQLNIQYYGPNDGTERYYRLNITESAPPVKDQKKRSANLSLANKIEAILVVRPRQQKLSYRFNNNEVHNTGNGYLVVLVDEQCGKKEKVTHYLAPGSRYSLPAITATSQVSLALDNQLKMLLDNCKKR